MTKARAAAVKSVKSSTPKTKATKLVRLKPLDARRGRVMKTYIHAPTGMKFEERRGWYKVDVELADYLEQVHQQDGDQDSPFAFDIASADEAKRIDERERKVAEKRAQAGDANDLTTRDLRRRADGAEPPAPDRHSARRSAEPARRERSMRVADAD